MTDLFDKPVDRWGSNSAKWDAMALRMPESDHNTIPMWIADMDFDCPPEVVQAVRARVDRRIFGYSVHTTPRYYRAVCAWFLRRFGFFVNSRDLVITPGVVDAVKTAVLALTQPGDGVLIQKPVYYPFFQTIEQTGRTVVDNPLINTGGYYTMDYEDLDAKLADPSVKLMILCSPHNPVGRVWREEELSRVGELCQKHGVPLVSDEIHWDFIRSGQKHVPIATLFPKWQDVITCTAPSKTFNLAGMYLSNIVVPNPEHRKRIEALGLLTTMSNPMSIVAVQAAYEQCDGWLDALNAYLDQNFSRMSSYLAQHLPRARFQIPEGTYLAWLDVSAYCGDTRKLEGDLIREAGVALECGETFGDAGRGYLRINCACPWSQLEAVLARLALYLNRLSPGQALRPFSYDSPRQAGKSMDAGGRKKLLVFLRHLGCPLCQVDMAGYAAHAQAFGEKGIDLYFILQDTPEMVGAQYPDEMPWEVVCDPSGSIFDQYAVPCALSADRMLSAAALQKMQQAPASTPPCGQEAGRPLQLPAAICFDEQGMCTYAHYGRDAGDLPAAEALLEQL